MQDYYVYILASDRNGTLYTGVTNNLVRRIYEHKNEVTKSFTEQYSVKKLVYFEVVNDINTALQREKVIKHWKRVWKLQIIEKHNPEWTDLYTDISGAGFPMSSRQRRTARE